MDEKKLLNTLYYLAGQGYGDNTVWEIIDKMENREPVTLEIRVKTPEEYQEECRTLREKFEHIADEMLKLRNIPQPKREEETTVKICAATGGECTWCGMGPCDSRKEVTP